MDLSAKSFASFLENDTVLPVFLCIGTDRVIGDALGPIVGDELVRRHNVPCFVYGTLDLPVTALNLGETLDFIGRTHRGAKVIAVDSSLGDPKDVGRIRLIDGGIRPGLASGKKLPLAGDLSVTATVAPVSGGGKSLGAVRLGTVYRLACEIAASLSAGISLLPRFRLRVGMHGGRGSALPLSR